LAALLEEPAPAQQGDLQHRPEPGEPPGTRLERREQPTQAHDDDTTYGDLPRLGQRAASRN